MDTPDTTEVPPENGSIPVESDMWTEMRALRQYQETVLGPTLTSLAAQITWTNQQIHAAMTALAQSPLAAILPQQTGARHG